MLSATLPDPFEGTPYRVQSRLGSGGMGEVFLVQHREVGKLFAAKLMHGYLVRDARTLERMRIEAEATGQLQHPHITSIAAFGRTPEGRPYIVMEYLRGRTLREELVEHGALPVLDAVTHVSELLSALAAAHAIGIVHRDIKPDNLFVCQEPRRLLKVLDFGIARVASESSPVKPLPAELMTNTGELVGTPLFQSPEGARGQHVDTRADLYAAGLVLYVLLTGRGPFDHHDGSAVLSAHTDEDPAPPSRYAAHPIPAELDRVVLKALSKSPDRRYQTAEEFRSVLLEVKKLVQQGGGTLPAEGARASAPPTTAALPAPDPATARGEGKGPRLGTVLALTAIFLVTGAAAAAVVVALYGAP